MTSGVGAAGEGFKNISWAMVGDA